MRTFSRIIHPIRVIPTEKNIRAANTKMG